MFLCVWTAVHLNLPEHKKEWQQKWRHLGWLLLALLAPEVVAWNAFEQWREVKRTTSRVRDAYCQLHKFPFSRYKQTSWRGKLADLRRRIRVGLYLEAGDLPCESQAKWPDMTPEEIATTYWTDVHSWNALMGGLVFDTRSADRPFLPQKMQRITLTLYGLANIMHRFDDPEHFAHWTDILPSVTKAEILARSKQDSLLKLITCWQATWFCVQCILRLCQGFSITLLELNVFGHALCALIIYVFWFDKPKDVSEPTTMTGRKADAVAAWLTNLNQLGQPKVIWTGRKSDEPQGKPRFWWERASTTCSSAAAHTVPASITTPRVYKLSEAITKRGFEHDGTVEAVLHVCKETSGWDLCYETNALDKRDFSQYSLILDPADVERLNASTPILLTIPTTVSDSTYPHRPKLVVPRISNWSVEAVLDVLFGLGVKRILNWLQYVLALTVAAGAYGGLHITAWHSIFPSVAEKMLWRAACITIIVSGLTLAVFGVVSWCVVSMRRRHRDGSFTSVHRIIMVVANSGVTFGVTWVLLGAWILWYLLCRTFLVVESFIMLAHISEADLHLPVWSRYVPHVT
ncbi:hypothetical protein Tdes44962_MAKER04925 [Teratosphaeria destructans]|uniref:Uncharacterized protein n=1 Tax=Teratosphaeria destructans TaxID=418781 RepID=A0A9W7SL14_9PEZI|nr:hypothetical protein Tdes44962_MAKER04925 [Teratosphaeria destructans]